MRRTWRHLSEDGILSMALQLVEEDSLEGLSMRKLGAALDVNPMAIYQFFPTKAELLRGIAKRIRSDITVPDPSDPDWRHQIQLSARSHRWVAASYPKAFALLLPPYFTSITTTESAEANMALLRRAGFEHDAAVAAWLTIGNYISSDARWEVWFSREGDLASSPKKGARLVPPYRSPDHEKRELAFEFGLDLILRGIEDRLKVGERSLSKTGVAVGS